MTKLLLTLSLFVLLPQFVFPTRIADPSPYERARALAAKMSLAEQISMVHGYNGPYVGNVDAQPLHGIPELHLEDGPQGVADGVKLVTCWPNALSVVSTFDVELMETYASALAEEQRGKGTNVMLGPMTNLARIPMGGRNFESFGEDPYLASVMMVPNIHGIQKKGVIACAKHYFNNNQEHDRGSVSANVDSRTEHELYYPPFRAAVDAGTGSIMCSYNKVNGTYACENPETLTKALKQSMGFQGFVMSDWGATHSTVQSANAGLDMEMPGQTYFGQKVLQKAVSEGAVSKDRVLDMVVRILTPMFAVGIMDTPQTGNLSANVQSKEHAALARSLAEKIAVLIRNDGILPLDQQLLKKIAIIGDDGGSKAFVTGGGSGHVICPYVVSPYEGFKSRLGEGSVSYAQTHPISGAAKVAAAADVAIVFVGVESSEGRDRDNLSLGDDQDELIEAVAAAQPNTVVVLNVPGSVTMPWISKIRAAVVAWYPGQEFGNAITSVLLGDVNPSARLPISFPVDEDHTWLKTPIQYPGVNGVTEYTEKLEMGYRWFDAAKEAPLFPFGHGLSYTAFTYQNLTVSAQRVKETEVKVNLEVTNSGKLAGREIVQLYLGYPASAGEPPKLLRGFVPVDLAAGETKKDVEFVISGDRSVSVWSVNKGDWEIVPGTYELFVGASAGDIRLTGSFEIQ